MMRPWAALDSLRASQSDYPPVRSKPAFCGWLHAGCAGEGLQDWQEDGVLELISVEVRGSSCAVTFFQIDNS